MKRTLRKCRLLTTIKQSAGNCNPQDANICTYTNRRLILNHLLFYSCLIVEKHQSGDLTKTELKSNLVNKLLYKIDIYVSKSQSLCNDLLILKCNLTVTVTNFHRNTFTPPSFRWLLFSRMVHLLSRLSYFQAKYHVLGSIYVTLHSEKNCHLHNQAF